MIGREKGKIPIRKILKKRDIGLYHRIETLWKEAHELQERQQSKEHHQQGYLHCEVVENNLGKIISDDEKYNRFSQLELFLLSAAACYHDVGKSDDFDEGHAMVAMRDIYSHPEKYHLSNPEGKVLSNIIGSHDIDEVFNETPETYPIGSDDVSVKLLSALFKLADVFHTDNSRIPHIVVGDVKKEDDKTRFRKLIQGWSFNDESQIVLKAAPEDTNDINIIAKGVSMMQKQLECVSPVLRSEEYPYEIIYSCDNRGIKWKAETENKRNLIEMDFYTENEADIFKGRDFESKGLLKKVIGSNISLLIGNSGVGKTSLIRAGLFPKLSKMGWICIWTRPMNPTPLDRILNDINAKLPIGYESNDIISSVKKLSEQYESDIIIVIDQFEDVLRSSPPVRETIGKMLLRIYGKSFKNVHILLSYRGDYEPEINSFLEYSGVIIPSRFPLLGLDSTGAHEALRSIFETNNVGILDDLLGKITKELEKESEHGRFHPPLIQIVASSLISLAKSNENTITLELYNNKVGSVETIIGAYLLNRLNEFGDIDSKKRINAEAILKELVRDKAKEQKGKEELLRYLNILEEDIQELLDKLVNMRLVRHLDNDIYEIIHDYLASKVEEMIKDKERSLRSARDILRTKAQHYRFMPIPSLLEKNEMILLYSMKESVNPSIQEKELLMFSYLMGNGPVWWWFRENEEMLRTIIKKALASVFSIVRAAAVSSFGKLGVHDDLKIVKDMLNDPDSNVRITAVKAFEKLGTPEDLQAIKEVLKDPDRYVRVNAVAVFQKLGTYDDLPIIKEMLKDHDWAVRTIAITTFGRLATHNDIGTIEEMLKDNDKNVREEAITTFKRLVTQDELTNIHVMLKDRHRNLRATAVMAFEKLGVHDNLVIIKNMLNDRAMDVRAAAVNVFGRLGNHDDLATIKGMLNDHSGKVRAAAVHVFGNLGNHDDFETVKEMLKDEDSDVKRAAVTAFEKLATSEDIETIKVMLEDSHWDVKRAAIAAFTKIATHNDLPVIKEILNDWDSDVRDAAIRAFKKLITRDDFLLIKDMLNDQDSNVRIAAVKAFEKIGIRDDIPLIKDMLNDPDSNVRIAAVKAFEKIGIRDDIPLIKEKLKDTYKDVRAVVANLFEKREKENDLQEIAEMYANGDGANDEALTCIISLDEKFYSPFK